MDDGTYHRLDLFNRRARRQTMMLQRSTDGVPVYVESADFTDWARIVLDQTRRLALRGLSGLRGEGAWEIYIADDEPDNCFHLRGGDGDNTDVGASEAWLGGHCALLYRSVRYDAQRDAAFNEDDAWHIHHRASSVAEGVLTDATVTLGVNALIGYFVHVEGAGDFEVFANTAAGEILLVDFHPGDYPDLPARPWYWINLKPVADADQEQPVYLDVHLEDWGVAEDPALDHNAAEEGGGGVVECGRRLVLIQRVWVRQNIDLAESPTSDYEDAAGHLHYVLHIGNIVRRVDEDGVGIPAIDPADVNQDEVELFASTAEEVKAARAFAGTCVEDQPSSLAERLLRETSVITVGTAARPGMYNGAQGLLDALACNASGARTVFLRNGVYDLSDLDQDDTRLTVRQGWSLIGESREAIVVLAPDAKVSGNAAAECMWLDRDTLVQNVYLWRVNTAGANVTVRAAKQGAELSRVFIRDEHSGGTALLLSGPDASCGAVAAGVEVEKTNGGIGVRFAELVVEPPALQGGRNVTVDASLTSIAHGASYGRALRQSRISCTASSHSEENAAVYVGAGDSVLVSGCAIVADGCQTLVVAAALAPGDAPSAWESRGGALVESSTFLVRPSAVYAAAGSSGMRLASGRVVLRDCRLEALYLSADATHYPKAMLRAEPGTKLLDADVDGLYVRTLSAIGAQVTVGEANASKVRLRADAVPMSATAGPATAFLASSGTRGAVAIEGCRVLKWSGQTRGIDARGLVSVTAGHVDGTEVTQAALVTGNLPLTPAAAYCGRALPSGAPTFNDCHSTAHGGVGFLASGAAGRFDPVVFRDCHALGGGRSLAGFAVSGADQARIIDCASTGTLGPGVLNDSAQADAVIVVGGHFSDAGLAYIQEDDSFPAEGNDFNLSWAACLRDVALAHGCHTVRGAVGVHPAAGCTIIGGEFSESTHGVLVSTTGVTLEDPLATNCKTHGLFVRSGAARVSGRMRIRGSGVSGAKLMSVETFDLELDVHMSAKGGKGIYVLACLEDWRLVPRISCVNESDITPLHIDSCADGVVEGVVARGFARRPIMIVSTGNLRVSGLTADCGSAALSSLVMDSVTNLEFECARLRYGAILRDVDGQVVVSNFLSERRGLAVHPLSGCEPVLRDVTVRSAVAGATEVVAASGIYFGGLLGARVDCSVVMERCRVLGWTQIGTDLGEDVEPTAGRSAGIRVQAGGASTRVRLVECEMRGPGGDIFGALVGDLNVLCDYATDSDADQHRYGVRRLEVVNCVFRQEDPEALSNLPKLVAVVRNDLTAAHAITGNTFDLTTGTVGYLYNEMNGGNVYARVEFKGNASRRRVIDSSLPYLSQSEYVILDGGLAADDIAGLDNPDTVTGLTAAQKWTASPAEPSYIEVAVQRTNSVWAHLADYLPADPAAP